MPAKTFTTLLLGDVYSDSGCRVLFLKLKSLIKKYNADFVIANGENAYGGFGISSEQVDMLFNSGVNVITSGNHIWQNEDVFEYLKMKNNLLRPANYGNSVQGHGYCVEKNVGVINLIGRVNMPATDDPFKCALDCVREIKKQTGTVFVDVHGESSEEKEALAFCLDGLVTAVVGTHTHVQTADERILPKGTGFITDLGMCGPSESVIGCDIETAVKRQKTQMPIKAVPAEGATMINGVVVVSDIESGRALSIERFVD